LAKTLQQCQLPRGCVLGNDDDLDQSAGKGNVDAYSHPAQEFKLLLGGGFTGSFRAVHKTFLGWFASGGG
jgi:hypothetical protein